MNPEETAGPDQSGGGDLLVRGDEHLERFPGGARVTELPPRIRKRRRSLGDVHVSVATVDPAPPVDEV